MTRPRDSQRSAVYAAENALARLFDRAAQFPMVEIAGSTLTLPIERHFADLASLQRYVDALLALGWVRAQWPTRAAMALQVRERRGMTKAHYERATATLAVPLRGQESAWARRELVVLHEVAHHLAGDEEPDHGPEFTARLLALVDGVIGAEAAFALRVMLADQGAAIG